MNNTNAILIRFAEVFLKKGRRAWFLAKLKSSLERQIRNAGDFKVRDGHDFFLIVKKDAKGQNLPFFNLDDTLTAALDRTFGIASYAPCRIVSRDIEVLEQEVIDIADSDVAVASSFRIDATRSDKSYPLKSVEINIRLGNIVNERTKVKVNLKTPDVTIHCVILHNEAALFTRVSKGPGGLPIGSSGKVILLLSGGIDSPVAGYRMMRRGCEIEAVHFDAMPYTTPQAREKVIELARIMAEYQGSLNLTIVPFGAIQEDLRDKAPGTYLVILYRRFMLRIAARIAASRGALALCTGDNLGQVASQTLENMTTIGSAVNMTILRPLLTFDKMETVDLARRIGTYKTSILPFDDCCSLFVPPHPQTASRQSTVEEIETRFNIQSMVDEALIGAETIIFEEIENPAEVNEEEVSG